jgi:hypothetical protein
MPSAERNSGPAEPPPAALCVVADRYQLVISCNLGRRHERDNMPQ